MKKFNKERSFSIHKMSFSFNPWLLALGIVVFSVFLVAMIFLGNFLFVKMYINPKVVKSATVVQMPAVAGDTVRWSTIVKRSDITKKQYFIKIPKSAKNITIKTVTQKQADNVVVLSKIKPQSRPLLLALERAKARSRFPYTGLPGEEPAPETPPPPEAEPGSLVPDGQIVQTPDNQFVDVLPEIIPPEPVLGCMDSTATNYNPDATQDDASCIPVVEPAAGPETPPPPPDETPPPPPDEIVPPAETPPPDETPPPTETPAPVEPTTPPAETPPLAEVPPVPPVPEGELVQIDYETPAPEITEDITEHGKLVTVSVPEAATSAAPVEGDQVLPPVTDVLAFTNIPEIFKVGDERKIKIKWKSNGDQDVEFHAYDLDSNGKLDYVEWTIPHLSDQTFEIIYISQAFELDQDKNIVADIYDAVKTKDETYATVPQNNYVRVTFDQALTSQNDITVYARPTDSGQPSSIEVYPVYDDGSGNVTQGPLLVGVSDGTNPTFETIDHNGKYRILLSNLATPTRLFDLKIINASIDIDYIVDPSLAGYWKFDESSPGTFADSSGNGNTGTGYGASGSNDTPQPSTDVPTTSFTNSHSLNFDGTDDYVSMGTISALSTNKASLSFWWKRTSGTDQMPVGPYLVGNRFGIQPWSDGNVYVVAEAGVGNTYAFVAYSVTGWHHFAMVYDGTQSTDATKVLLYIDGVQQTLSAFNNPPVATSLITSDFRIGMDNNAGGRFGNGPVDDVRIYSRALSSTEVAALSAGNQIADTSGALRYWVATSTGNWNDTANWSTTSGGSSGASVPGSTSDAIFDDNGNGDCTVNAAIDVKGMFLTGYTGTISQSSNTVTVGVDGYNQYTGTFTGGSSAITISGGTFNQTGGTFTSTSGTFSVGGDLADGLTLFSQTGGTFTHNSGTVTFNPNILGQACVAAGFTVDLNSSLVFNNVTVIATEGCVSLSNGIIVASGDNLIVAGTLTQTNGNLDGAWELRGNLVLGSGSDGGTGTITFTQTANQTYATANGSERTAHIVINKSSGTVTPLSGTTVLNAFSFTLSQGSFTAPSGTFDLGSSLKPFVFFPDGSAIFTQASGTTFTPNSGTVSFAPVIGNNCSPAGATVDVNTSLTFNSLVFNAQDGCINALNKIIIASGDTLIAAGNVTFTRGGVTTGTLQAQGNVTVGANANGGNVPFQFTGTNAQTYTDNGGTKTTGTVTVNKVSGTVTLATAMSYNASGQDLVITSGTLDLFGYVLTVNDVLTVGSSGNLQLQGGESVDATTTLSTGSTVTYNGTSTYTGLELGNTYSNLTFNGTGGHWNLNSALTVGNNLTINAGTLDATASGCSSASCNITVSNNWSNSGTFTPRTGTVTLNGTSQIVSGSTTFNNLTIDKTNSPTVSFTSSTTQTIGGTFSSTGDATHQITIGATTTSPATLSKSSGTVSVNYTTLSYSTATGGATWQAFTSNNNIDNGNNSGWAFALNAAPTFTSVSDTAGYIKEGSNVTFTTVASDSDGSDTVQLFVCKANDFTGTTCGGGGTWCSSSASATNPTCNYTVQGSDVDGSHTYYASIIDNHNLEASSNPRSSTFNTDITKPTTTDNYAHDNAWVNSNQSITLTPADATSGVASTKYCTDSTNACDPTAGTAYTTAVSLTTEGTTYFRYESTDNAGNVQTTVSRTVKIDKTAPSVDVGNDQTKTSQFTQTGSASDATSGIISYLWTKTSGSGNITFGTAALADTTILADADATYVIRLTVTDNAGNSNFDEFTLVWSTPVSPTPTPTPTGGGGGGGGGSSSRPLPIQNPAPALINALTQQLNTVSNQVENVTNTILNPEKQLTPSQVESLVPEETPEAFKGWDLMTTKPIGAFDMSPVPSDISFFAEKFPEFNKFLRDVGVNKLEDLKKLNTVELTLPGFANVAALPSSIPTDVVFARTFNGAIDINTNLSFDDKGDASQKIEVMVNKPLELLIKPAHPAKSVTGFVVLSKKITAKQNIQDLQSKQKSSGLSWLIPVARAASNDTNPIPVQLLLQKFEYVKDKKGFYNAKITTPSIEGSYDIITVIDYQNPNLGPKQITLIAVVDPEGYVYTQLPEGKLRIAGATVSLYWLNPDSQKYELWPADKFLQHNPEVTDDTGKYAFLTPEGTYYLEGTAPNYRPYKSENFTIVKGSPGIFIDIELKKKGALPSWLNWPVGFAIALVFIICLLLYIAYKAYKKSKV